MNHIDSPDSVRIQPYRYQPTQPLPPVQWRLPYSEADLFEHRKTNLKRKLYQRRGGLHWLRLGRLTVQWSWRRA